MDKQKSAAVQVAKEKAASEEKITTLSTGVRAILVPVAASLIQAVTSKIKDPEIPIWHDPDKDRDVPNPTDPTYLKQIQEASEARAMAAVDASVMFGIELVDDIPDNGWDKKLQYLERLGHLNLTEFDFSDELDRDFLYKRYIAVGSDDLIKIARMGGLQPDDLDAADASFPGEENGIPD